MLFPARLNQLGRGCSNAQVCKIPRQHSVERGISAHRALSPQQHRAAHCAVARPALVLWDVRGKAPDKKERTMRRQQRG